MPVDGPTSRSHLGLGLPTGCFPDRGYRMASLLQFNHPDGWSWLAAVVRSNRPAALEVGDNMLTLTSAQTEFNLSIRMNL